MKHGSEMTMDGVQTGYTAFDGERLLARGTLSGVAMAAKRQAGRGDGQGIRVFDDATGRLIDLDLRGSEEEVLQRYAPAAADEDPQGASAPPRKRGRPKLGVVSREVTLLPRHWAWLRAQRGGASATLRRLVDQARRQGAHSDRARSAQDAAYRFMSAMLGDHPGYEEVIRALYAGDRERLQAETEGWPADLRDHSRRLAEGSFTATEAEG